MPEDPSDRFRTNVFGNAPGPRDWSPPVDPLAAGRARPSQGRLALRGLVYGLTIGAVISALVVVGVVLGRHGGAGGAGGSGGSGGGPVVLAAGRTPTPRPTEDGLDASTPVGTCLTAAAPAAVHLVSCTAPHRYELVSHERAAGTTYPGDDYWNGPVAERCYQDQLAYTGLARDSWPTGLDTWSFIPLASGWAAGDRDVDCVAQWTTDVTQSAKGLHPAPPAASPPVIAASSAPTVLAGPLVLVRDPAGSPGCLGVATGDGTFVLQPATRAFSWTVSVRVDGSLDDASSGIVRGADPAGRDFVAHTGVPVRVTGGWTTYAAPGMCGATRVFRFETLG